MKASPRKNQRILKGLPHVPFEEFPVRKVEELVVQLEKAKPKDAKVEVSPMEDSHHSPCLQEMTAVMIHDIEESRERPQIYALYQYCPTCKTAIRVF